MPQPPCCGSPLLGHCAHHKACTGDCTHAVSRAPPRTWPADNLLPSQQQLLQPPGSGCSGVTLPPMPKQPRALTGPAPSGLHQAHHLKRPACHQRTSHQGRLWLGSLVMTCSFFWNTPSSRAGRPLYLAGGSGQESRG